MLLYSDRITAASIQNLNKPIMSLLANTLQPPLLSLFDSSSLSLPAKASSSLSPSLPPLWSHTTDPQLPQDSVICYIRDYDSHPHCHPHNPGWEDIVLVDMFKNTTKQEEDATGKENGKGKGLILQRVLHIQSPTIKSTYIQAGCSRSSFHSKPTTTTSIYMRPRARARPLGITLPHLHIQFRRLGQGAQRPWAIELGVEDGSGKGKGGGVGGGGVEGIIRFSTFQVGVLFVRSLNYSGL